MNVKSMYKKDLKGYFCYLLILSQDKLSRNYYITQGAGELIYSDTNY